MLAKMFRMMKRGNKGFTLVELMVVVVIIGVLTAIAIPVYNNASKKAIANTIRANVRIIEGAISAYLTDNPGDEDVTQEDLEDGGYLKEWPTGPKYNDKDVNYSIKVGDDGYYVEPSENPNDISSEPTSAGGDGEGSGG